MCDMEWATTVSYQVADFPRAALSRRSSNGGSSKMSPALCQWSEVMNHPGLVCCVQQTTGIPLVVMVKPDTFLIQEIKTLPAKAKVRPTYWTHFLGPNPVMSYVG